MWTCIKNTRTSPGQLSLSVLSRPWNVVMFVELCVLALVHMMCICLTYATLLKGQALTCLALMFQNVHFTCALQWIATLIVCYIGREVVANEVALPCHDL